MPEEPDDREEPDNPDEWRDVCDDPCWPDGEDDEDD
jgi:hypothetical protein